jgi:hypothetical protein
MNRRDSSGKRATLERTVQLPEVTVGRRAGTKAALATDRHSCPTSRTRSTSLSATHMRQVDHDHLPESHILIEPNLEVLVDQLLKQRKEASRSVPLG